jgi:8-oxo-dGTP pyrophosphatase MutT (NUDIX family)
MVRDAGDSGHDGNPGDAESQHPDLLRWSETLASVARTGLSFSESIYEKERYEEILHVAGDMAAAAVEEHTRESQVEAWLALVGEGIAGYVTPKIAVGAVVGNDDGQILLIQRADSGIWLYPTGWADVGYSPAEVAIKEVKEETGIDVDVKQLIGVFDGMRLGFGAVPMYSLVFHCHATGGSLDPHPLEVLDAAWFDQVALPEPVSRFGHWGEHAFAAIRGDKVGVLYDHPRDEVWRTPEA